MCGILGFWSTRADGVDAEGLTERMMDRLAHRGPDGRGRHLDAGRALAMGHTRLSIIDLETGAQPLRSDDLTLTVNGEFYDYKAIRAQLRRTGEQFRTKSDSEIVLPLYRRHGLDFVHRLRGEFALALFDAARERLILARDRFGVRPLFIHLGADHAVWGSEIKAVLEHPAVPRRLSTEAALGQMMNLMIPGRTAFEGVEQVLPGHMLVIERRRGGFDVRDLPYWDLDFAPAEAHDPAPDSREWEQRVSERLIDAVRVRLEADVPVGCYLSGGIDSCSILGLAEAMQQSPVKAFTVGFDQAAYDETDQAREMAERVGADQVVVRVDGVDLYGESYVSAVRHAERAFYNPFGVAKWHLSRAVRDMGYRVVVTGEGSDELFGGYPFFKQDLFRLSAEDDAGLELARVTSSNELFKGATISQVPERHPAFEALCGFTPSWLHPWMKTLREARPLLSDDALADLGAYDPVEELATHLDRGKLEGRHPLDKAQYTYVKTLLESQVLGWSGDRMDMAHSMESRPAFLDHLLAETAVGVPPALRIRDGVEKWILRQAMKGLLPESLYRRQKFAFMAPPSHSDGPKRDAAGLLVDRFLGSDQIRSAGLFDPGRVAGFLARSRAEIDPVRRVRNDAILNQMLGIHILHAELVAVS